MVRLLVMLLGFCLYVAMAYSMFRDARQKLPMSMAFLLAWLWPVLLLGAIAHDVAEDTKELFSKRM